MRRRTAKSASPVKWGFRVGCGVILAIFAFIGAIFIIGGGMCVGTIATVGKAIEEAEKEKQRTEEKARQTVHRIGDTVHVGYMSYVVWRAGWSDRLSDNAFLDQRPDASFLFVKLTVRNNDKQARTIPPLKLVDEDGAEYETSSKAWAVRNGIGLLASLNPGVSKQGLVVFDVPRNHSYKLRLSGGYWSRDVAYVSLAEQAAQPPKAPPRPRTPSTTPKPDTRRAEDTEPDTRATVTQEQPEPEPTPEPKKPTLPTVSGEVTVHLKDGKSVTGPVFKSRRESLTLQVSGTALRTYKAHQVKRIEQGGRVVFDAERVGGTE